MADLVVIVPSRGRPQAARELIAAFDATCTTNPILIFAVDADDPMVDEYRSTLAPTGMVDVGVNVTSSRSMVEALNVVTSVWAVDANALGFMGDDHRPRTPGWDARYLEALRELGTGIVYGDDLLQGERLPTQCAMTADIVRALGYMAPPALRHMCVDNFWLDLGNSAGCIRYLPDVVVEHLHPLAGKAEVDAGYERVNAPGVIGADVAAYAAFQRDGMSAAVQAVCELRGTGEVHEWRLFESGTVPEYTRPDWYAGRDHAPHLEEGHRPRLQAAATFAAQAAYTLGVDTVVDLGAGDGGLLSLLGPALHAWGYDLQPANVEAAKRRSVDVRLGDAVAGDVEWGQVAVCTEMLEHLVDPHEFVCRIGQHAQALVCSSPMDERPGQAYEFHTWAWDLDGYRALVEQGGWRIIRQRPVGRFQVILAVRA
jgi:Methyltransferase domain